MGANKLRLTDRMEVVVVWPNSSLGSGHGLILDEVTHPLKDHVCSPEVLLDPALFLEKQVVATSAYY